MTVRAPAIEAQLVETYLLLAVNHQSPHRNEGEPHRPCRAGPRGDGIRLPPGAGGGRGDPRRARGVYRAAAPAPPARSPTSSTAFPLGGTMAHSWVQMFDSEYEAFRAYCESYPDERRAAGGYLQHAQIRHSQRHPRLQRRAQAHAASPNAASGSTPAICPISRRRPAACSTRRAGQSCNIICLQLAG